MRKMDGQGYGGREQRKCGKRRGRLKTRNMNVHLEREERARAEACEGEMDRHIYKAATYPQLQERDENV